MTPDLYELALATGVLSGLLFAFFIGLEVVNAWLLRRRSEQKDR